MITRRALLASATLLVSCARPPAAQEEQLPDFGPLPDFSLTTHTGEPFHRASLQGNVWIVDFIFTNCTLVCPRMTAEMRKLQLRTAHLPQVRLLSLSIDPDRDTVPVLNAYAALHHADPQRWLFLTGAKPVIRRIQEATQRHLDPEEFTAHSKQFYLVDGAGFVRGVYSVVQPTALDDLLHDIPKLLRNPRKPEPDPNP
ncbi:MAG: SCO family protein [Bryobacterales bacterium]|nr:SCO family protein [Bryobacterales bacterium]